MNETLNMMADMMEHHRIEDDRNHTVVKRVDHRKGKKLNVFDRTHTKRGH
jgi:hypothetical protein